MSRISKTGRPMPKADQHKLRINQEITVSEVRLIDAEGNNIGIISIEQAIKKAQESKLDLVEISPAAVPPVCKILDYGKYKYHKKKKMTEEKKKQKTIETKEIKLRPTIEQHDYQVKLKAILRFLSEGNKVKVTLRFRGREMAYTQLGMQVLERVKADIQDAGKIDSDARIEGRQAVMIIAPNVVVK